MASVLRKDGITPLFLLIDLVWGTFGEVDRVYATDWRSIGSMYFQSRSSSSESWSGTSGERARYCLYNECARRSFQRAREHLRTTQGDPLFCNDRFYSRIVAKQASRSIAYIVHMFAHQQSTSLHAGDGVRYREIAFLCVMV